MPNGRVISVGLTGQDVKLSGSNVNRDTIAPVPSNRLTEPPTEERPRSGWDYNWPSPEYKPTASPPIIKLYRISGIILADPVRTAQ